MIVRDAFSTYHPLVNFLFFGLTLGFSMFIQNPACLAVSIVCAAAYAIYLNGKRAVWAGAFYMLPMLIITALLNPAFSHAGGTILTYLPGGNPLTLESIIYGIAAAVTLITVIIWFSCFNAVITSDKFVYLFGRLIPALSLILSMSLRLVPLFRARIAQVAQAQRRIGRGISNGGVFSRVKHGIRIVSIMLTWALENAIETADSMKSRGYGLPGRTAFSIYRIDRRDIMALGFLMLCGGYIMLGSAFGGLYFRYFPTIRGAPLTLYTLSVYTAYFMLCAMPIIINIREDMVWKALKSRI